LRINKQHCKLLRWRNRLQLRQLIRMMISKMMRRKKSLR
jgi:hypothetical protein